MDIHLLQQRIFQFLVHSFLYYKLGESLISDQQYDQICQELKSLLQSSPPSSVPYVPLVKPLGEEASGFFIKKYPPSIISTALHLLYQANYVDHLSFPDFIERQGYRFALLSDSNAP